MNYIRRKNILIQESKKRELEKKWYCPRIRERKIGSSTDSIAFFLNHHTISTPLTSSESTDSHVHTYDANLPTLSPN